MSDDGDMDAYGPMGIDLIVYNTQDSFPVTHHAFNRLRQIVSDDVNDSLTWWTGWDCVEWLGDGSPDTFKTGILRNSMESINA
ncbi:unnamed protein product [marine sediment metagenome]|uniref:Uncharacterized protein n=1 Tax=marine sediment metagenome TaxID=412755 RepID=X0VBI6_9ZZZZ